MKKAIIIILIAFASHANAQSFTQLAIAGTLSGVSGYADGVREAVNFHYAAFKIEHPDANDQFWNPKQSWTNKHKKGGLYRTVLVGTTDGYHAMGTVRNVAGLTSAVVLYWETEKDWWYYTPWIRTKWDKDGKKPILAYPAEAAFLFGCNRIGFTLAYDLKYSGK